MEGPKTLGILLWTFHFGGIVGQRARLSTWEGSFEGKSQVSSNETVGL
jgi:hypothetical protein